MANGLSFIAVHLISIVINCKSEPDGNLQRDATMNYTLHIAAVGARTNVALAAARPRSPSGWPGLAAASPYENRDLKPTTSLDALIGRAVAAHFALDPALAVPKLFAGSSNGNMSGLIRG